MKDDFTHFSLGMGITVPFLYFGMQVLALPFFPHYSILSMDASTLGSRGSAAPGIFNIGAVLTGVITLLAAPGFYRALIRQQTSSLLAWLTSIAIGMSGLSSVWAGLFPLPSPLHSANPFMPGLFLLPTALAAALWHHEGAGMIKAYLVITIVVCIGLVPILYGINTQGYDGLMQRIIALVFLPPIGAGAYFLAMRTKDGE